MTDFGSLCVFCSRDRILDKTDDEIMTPCKPEPEPPQEEDEPLE